MKAVVNSLNTNAQYQLWHQRLGHASDKIMQEATKNCIGIPKLVKPQFFECSTCMSSKFRKKHIGLAKKVQSAATKTKELFEVGQHLHIDFGFMRGSDYSKKDDEGKLMTSIDGFRSYCLIIDRQSRYITIILAKQKKPPIQELRHLLQQLRSRVKSQYCTITTDLGGEVAKSKSFRNLLLEKDIGYTLRTTGAYSSAQNGLAEKPHQDLGRMTRSLLYSAGLSSKYWSYALRHAVYLKNRLPHSSLHYKTPYECVNNTKPNLSNLRVFGSKVHFMTKPRSKKLDRMDAVGRFMTYKGTDTIAYVIDETTKRERLATHLNFDEAFTSSPAKDHPHMAVAMQQSGYLPSKEQVCRMKIKLLHKNARLPERGSEEAAGLDLYACDEIIIKPGCQEIIPSGIAVEIPPRYHIQVHARSSLVTKQRGRVEAGLIDSDYRGQIFVVISNNGNDDIKIDAGERYAQLVVVQDPNVTVTVSHDITATKRNDGKFGSTGNKTLMTHIPSSPTSTTAAAASLHDNLAQSAWQVTTSHDPYINVQDIEFQARGKHPTQGMLLKDCDEWIDKVLITTCKQGTATAKIPEWTKRLKGSVLLEINHHPITSTAQALKFLSNVKKNDTVHIKIGIQDRVPMHDDEGIPIMYFDQLLYISQHLNQIKYDRINEKINPSETKIPPSTAKLAKAIKQMNIKGIMATLHGILPKSKMKSKRLTRNKLKNTPQWNQWKMSEWKQLDQYWEQKMFGEPCILPPNANVLSLLWCYNVKDDGTLKARMVCNGKPSDHNTVIFGYTYAKSLDHVGSRIFWAAAATKNFYVQGADASNAFAEAKAPEIPLYVRVNEQYREWWQERMKRPPIPRGYVLPVHRALQGHPEAPRAWATLIDTILQTKLQLKPTKHEPCLYHGYYKGKEILFLRQVDDFAVAAATQSLTGEVINEIDKYMKIKIKDLGKLTRYNGVDVIQSKHFIKLNNPTYIRKIIQEHSWMIENYDTPNKPIPIPVDKHFSRQLEEAQPPTTDEDKVKLQIKMKFNYRQAIGELIFAMVTCRPDISFPLIKLSQYASNPAQQHYEAVIHIFQYLHATIDEGLIYWRSSPNHELPEHPLPTVHSDNYDTTERQQHDDAHNMHALVDSDWAGDTNHRKSVSGIILRLAGGTILYKTKFQDTIALSTTEAEFTAACDAGKAILYVRSILDEINLDQDQATTLYIDNNGALLMGNAQQPTRRTRHMDLRKFALLDWIKRDLLLMKRVKTSMNCSDTMTKQTGKQLFYRHFDYILGRVIPDYVNIDKTQISTLSDNAYHEYMTNTNLLSCLPIMPVSSVCSYEHGGDIIPVHNRG